jgi:primosomal replication protein N
MVTCRVGVDVAGNQMMVADEVAVGGMEVGVSGIVSSRGCTQPANSKIRTRADHKLE